LDSPPFHATPRSSLVAAVEAALSARGMTTEPELKSGTTEASVYASAGIDTVVFGPGAASGNIHRPNECVPLADLEAAVDIYTDVIGRLCSS
jgi:acetylornithine deacetylase/succinyl-diaminopimelate desuccinylase-like protein